LVNTKVAFRWLHSLLAIPRIIVKLLVFSLG